MTRHRQDGTRHHSASLLAGWLMVTAGCQPSSNVRYNGRVRPPAVSGGSAVRIVAGRAEPPVGHEVLGVITTQCTTLDGGTGVGEAPCTEASMTERAREEAATRGGTALFALVCGVDDSDRFANGAGLQGRAPVAAGRNGASRPVSQGNQTANRPTTIRTITTCRATVLRREDGGAIIGAVDVVDTGRDARTDDASASNHEGERIVVSGQSVRVTWAPGAAAAAGGVEVRRDPSEIGELTTWPPGYPELGRLHGHCAKACPQSVVLRGLKQVASARGGIALARIRCAPQGGSWTCETSVVGPAPPPAPVPDEKRSPTEPEGGLDPDG
ncbi:MAG: hypothetical protein AAF928_14555 [Myxococcota bacterium]